MTASRSDGSKEAAASQATSFGSRASISSPASYRIFSARSCSSLDAVYDQGRRFLIRSASTDSSSPLRWRHRGQGKPRRRVILSR